MKVMTEPQRRVVERLLSKGWIEPLHYRCCVYLFLPDFKPGRQTRLSRNWRRKPILVTPAGNVLPGQAWEPETVTAEGTEAPAVKSQPGARKNARPKRKT